MVKVIGVRFKRAGKVYYFDPGEFTFAKGDQVIVETARGIEFGDVAGEARDVSEEELATPLKKVIRAATAGDVLQLQENQAREKEAFTLAARKITEHSLEMDLVDVEFTFDGNKIIFYFTAEGRVDFRELVRDLAAIFRTRIELRQIGVRDEAKMIGGIGPCGRMLCCSTFLGDFAPVSIKMAKEQNLSLNPTKISGLCGRLLCCLRYESEHYESARANFPAAGTAATTADGAGKVMAVNVIKGMVTVELPTGVQHDYPVTAVKWTRGGAPGRRSDAVVDEPAANGAANGQDATSEPVRDATASATAPGAAADVQTACPKAAGCSNAENCPRLTEGGCACSQPESELVAVADPPTPPPPVRRSAASLPRPLPARDGARDGARSSSARASTRPVAAGSTGEPAEGEIDPPEATPGTGNDAPPREGEPRRGRSNRRGRRGKRGGQGSGQTGQVGDEREQQAPSTTSPTERQAGRPQADGQRPRGDRNERNERRPRGEALPSGSQPAPRREGPGPRDGQSPRAEGEAAGGERRGRRRRSGRPANGQPPATGEGRSNPEA